MTNEHDITLLTNGTDEEYSSVFHVTHHNPILITITPDDHSGTLFLQSKNENGEFVNHDKQFNSQTHLKLFKEGEYRIYRPSQHTKIGANFRKLKVSKHKIINTISSESIPLRIMVDTTVNLVVDKYSEIILSANKPSVFRIWYNQLPLGLELINNKIIGIPSYPMTLEVGIEAISDDEDDQEIILLVIKNAT